MQRRTSKLKALVYSGITAVGLATALTASASINMAAYSYENDVGSPGRDGQYDRVITITPDAQWVNVTQDETVKFVDAASGKSFVWHFDTASFAFDLGRVASNGALAGRHVQAYIATNPRNLSGG